MAAFQPESIVFDIDGTLWDSTEICARAWNDAIARLGIAHREFVPADVAGIMGLTADEIRAKFFGPLPVDRGAGIIREMFRCEIEHLGERGAPLYPGVAEGVRELASRYRLYVVSNCDEPYLHVFLRASGLGQHVLDWECHGRTGRSKGENLADLARRNALGAAVYVGDTAGDEKAARFAGMRFYFVEYGFGRAWAPDRSFAGFPALVRALMIEESVHG
jgi:phosphoglycolate phosphatase